MAAYKWPAGRTHGFIDIADMQPVRARFRAAGDSEAASLSRGILFDQACTGWQKAALSERNDRISAKSVALVSAVR